MKIGNLEFTPVNNNLNFVGDLVAASIKTNNLTDMWTASIDPNLSDTAAFCEHYQIGLDISVNCVIVEAKRGERTWYAAVLVPATSRADINGIVRRYLDAKKVSFASMESAVSQSGMAYGAISPLGLPTDWPILVDSGAAGLEWAVIGSGVRESKLVVPGKLLASLPNAIVLSLVKATI
jgi:prolyl-tRNA editing enzyme YbaK/EbsC (Cys-tRNA(Pro) deacylase)